MKTITIAEFVDLMEHDKLEWPPFQVGGYVYSRSSGGDISQVGRELYRAMLP